MRYKFIHQHRVQNMDSYHFVSYSMKFRIATTPISNSLGIPFFGNFIHANNSNNNNNVANANDNNNHHHNWTDVM